MIRLVFHGHAAVELQAEDTPTLLFDPYRPDGLDGRFQLPPIDASPDVIAITHHHEDHAWRPAAWAEVPTLDHAGNCGGLVFDAMPAYHDTQRGTRMGLTTLLAVTYAGMRVVHLGDLGTALNPAQEAFVGTPDVLIVPVGGTYTLGPPEAAALIRRVAPSWAIPVHARHPRIDLPLRPVEEFLAAWTGARMRDVGSAIVLDERPAKPTVVPLEPAMGKELNPQR